MKRRLIPMLATVGLVTLVAATEPPDFGTLNLSPGFTEAEGTVEGYTAGSVSIPAIANRDQDGDLCLGYAGSGPDVELLLQQNFPHLVLQVDGEGHDVTLLVQGPDEDTIRCADNINEHDPLVTLEDTDWQAGTYRVWVGSVEPDVEHDYTLTVQE